jgi:hypothetical protein
VISEDLKKDNRPRRSHSTDDNYPQSDKEEGIGSCSSSSSYEDDNDAGLDEIGSTVLMMTSTQQQNNITLEEQPSIDKVIKKINSYQKKRKLR